MAIIQIGTNSYECPEGWENIPLDRGIRLHKACAALPDRIRAVYAPVFNEKAEPVTLKDEELTLLADFQREVVGILCDIPTDILSVANSGDIAEVYNTMLATYAMSMMYQTLGFEPKGVAYFDWQGERYYFPDSGKDIVGNPAYMQGLSALRLAQLSDLAAAGDKMAGGEYGYAATMVAIACLREGEQYSEAIARERTPIFASVPMSVVLEVFFCLQQLTIISQMNTRIAMAEAERKETSARERASRSHGPNGSYWSLSDYLYRHKA